MVKNWDQGERKYCTLLHTIMGQDIVPRTRQNPSLYSATVEVILFGCKSTLHCLHIMWITGFPLEVTTEYMVLKGR